MQAAAVPSLALALQSRIPLAIWCATCPSSPLPSSPFPISPLLIPALPLAATPRPYNTPTLSSPCSFHFIPAFPPFNSVFSLSRSVSYTLRITSVTRSEQVTTMAGTGPEYDYPVTGKDEPIPVVGEEDPVAGAGEPVPGEDAQEFSDKDIAAEEKLENKEAGEWSEDMASNEPLPGEETDPDLSERLPSDRG